MDTFRMLLALPPGAPAASARNARIAVFRATSAKQAHGDGDHDRCDGEAIQREQPGRAAVGAAADSVQGGGGPNGEVEVVRAPPEAVREPAAVVVADREREQQLGRDDPKRDPHSSVA